MRTKRGRRSIEGGRFHVIEIGKTFVKNSCGKDLNQSYQLCSEHIPPDHRLLCNLAAFGYSPPAHKLKKKTKKKPHTALQTDTWKKYKNIFVLSTKNVDIWALKNHEFLYLFSL